MSSETFVSFPEAARLCGVPLSTIYAFDEGNKIPPEQIRWHKTRRRIHLEWFQEAVRAGQLYERQPSFHLPGGLLIRRHVARTHAGEGRSGGAGRKVRPSPDLLAVAARLAKQESSCE